MFFLSLIGLSLGVPRLIVAADNPKLLKPLRFSVKPIIPKARSHAPQLFEIGLDCDSDKFFEGRLELKWYLGKRLVHHYVSHELAVTPGGQRLRVALPPVVVHSEKTPVTAYARFISSRQVLDLGEVNPVIPVDWKRAFAVVYVEPHELAGPHKEAVLVNVLGLEQLGPPAEQQFNLLSYPSRLPPEDLPAVAAGYASFDLLIMEGEGFQQVRGAQLAAIGDWVAGGGSVVVVPRGTLGARHVNFLNRLAGEIESQGTYALDERGQLVVGERALAAGKKLGKYRAGVGRAVVVHDALDPDVDFETAEWKAAVAFLWKVSRAQLEAILRTGGWDFAPPPMSQNYLTPRPFAPQPGDLAESIGHFLLPSRIKGMPLSIVIVILSLFLLAVAPGDYFLLGRLNCRKYTWWSFALISASFTLCTVKVAESYMGDIDYRTGLTFVDLETFRNESGTFAKAARSSRFELLFVATQQTIETSLRNCLFADMRERTGPTEDLQFRRPRFAQFDDTELDETEAVVADLPEYEGAMPSAFTVRQQLRQWSPRITRQTTLADDPTLLANTHIDWSLLSAIDVNSTEGRRAFFETVLAREPEAQLLLLNQKQAFGPTLQEGDSTAASASSVPGAVIWTPPGAKDSVMSILELQSAAPILLLAARVSVRPASGLFAIVSQVSPTGSENLEDLTLLDQTDPDQWLFIACIRRNSDWVVYRKLFSSASTAEGR